MSISSVVVKTMAMAKKKKNTRIKRDENTIASILEARKRFSSEDYQGCWQVCRSILEHAPQEPEALYMLGVLAGKNGQYPSAVALLRQAIALDDRQASYLDSLGAALLNLKQLEDAATNFKAAIRLNPNLQSAHYNLGNLHLEKGDLGEAKKCFENALRIRPSYTEARNNLGVALLSMEQPEQAIACFEKVLKKMPARADTWCNLGVSKMRIGMRRDAEISLLESLKLAPGSANTHHHMGYFYKSEWNLAKAAEHYKQALQLGAGQDSLNNLGNILNDQGKHQEAYALFEKLCTSTRPPEADYISNLLLILNYIPGMDAKEVFKAHAHWGGELSRSVDKLPRLSVKEQGAIRPLKVGYVSRDFREHSVAYFIESVLANHDPARVSVHCYSDVKSPDEVARRLQACVPHWRDIHGLSHREAAARIRRDGIHILVDLAGHTGKNRLSVFAARPAPIQATYLGYPNTTGLPEIDYRVTDRLADPPGLTDALHTEKLARLPSCFLCYKPSDSAPLAGQAPCAQGRGVTFGCFNHLAKVNDRLIALWVEILKGVPRSRLLLKSAQLADEEVREHLSARFEAGGVERSRIELLGQVESNEEHLSLYNTIDIALDTYPYNGTTTTFEALWMGVPVLTLTGPVHASRVGASILTSLQKQELIAETEQEYRNKAIGLAHDVEKIREYRATLRNDLSESILMDGKRIAAELEDIFAAWWENR